VHGNETSIIPAREYAQLTGRLLVYANTNTRTVTDKLGFKRKTFRFQSFFKVLKVFLNFIFCKALFGAT